jgi:transposase
MWTPQNRKRYDRSRLRYPSDLTDEEWAHVAPVIPPAKHGGNKRGQRCRVRLALRPSWRRCEHALGMDLHA